MLIHPENLKLTTASGEAAGNTQSLMGVVLGIFIKPASETTTFSYSITNPSGIVIHYRTGETGTVSEYTRIPVRGIYTINLFDADANEDFIVELGIEEW